MQIWPSIHQLIASGNRAVLVTITNVKGSAPRDVGTQMVLSSTGKQVGTIGGGKLEWQALMMAEQLFEQNNQYFTTQADFILGPDLDQCCGGHVTLQFEGFTKSEVEQVREKAQRETSQNTNQPVFVFGAGHVGKAVINALAPLAFDITWFDSRKNMFPDTLPQNVKAMQFKAVSDCFELAKQNTFVLIMTHEHGLDFDITNKALKAKQIVFTGLIGSQTKKARFTRRLAEQGLSPAKIEKLTCPIGIKGISDKSPPAIAASVATQLLQQIELLKIGKNPVQLVKNSA